jgi:predicted nucleotidyltransferase component of viral defense system
MKDHLRHLLAGAGPPRGTHIAREYLQARILGGLQRVGAMVPLAFQGGTALRFLYSLPRHSEDLDFALERAAEEYDLRRYVEAVRRELEHEAYDVEVRVKDRRTVHAAFVRFPGLLHELGLAPRPAQILSVKIEVDTRPPRGARLETTIVRRHLVLQLQHHDKASLFAGKLHAILARPWVKGRDVYDLVWYLSDRSWPGPNLELLNNALDQTGWRGGRLEEKTWPDALWQRLDSMRFDRVAADVEPFLEIPSEVALLNAETLKSLLAQRRGRARR